MKILSVIIPVYNEKKTILRLLEKVREVTLVNEMQKQIIIVDDGSTDGTRDVLKQIPQSEAVVVMHELNQGKGMAIRTGLAYASGDYVVIQDADLEYDPADYNPMLAKMIDEDLVVIYGSRELQKQVNRYSGLSFYLGGLLLTRITNILYSQNLTDEATCYKMFKTDFIKSLPLTCRRFEFCPEVTSLTALHGVQICEVGISYYPRHKNEGKKIKWRDGLEAIWVLVKYRFKGKK